MLNLSFKCMKYPLNNTYLNKFPSIFQNAIFHNKNCHALSILNGISPNVSQNASTIQKTQKSSTSIIILILKLSTTSNDA